MALSPQSLNLPQADVQQNIGFPVKFTTDNRHAPAADTAAVVTVTGDANVPITLTQIWCSYSATPTGGSVQVQDGTDVVWSQHIAAAGPNQFTFYPPLMGTKNQNLVVTLAAGGGAVVGTLTINAHKQS